MNLNTPTSTEEIIINALASTSENGEILLTTVRQTKPRFTKQALYVVLRKLLQQEVVVKHGKQFSLARPWLSKMTQFFSIAQERYGVRTEGVDFLNLTDGDKISYVFKSPHEADRFWGHAFDVLAAVMPQSEPVYIYNPHEWFILARAESELHLFSTLKDKKRQIWLTVGNRDPLDIFAKQYFDGTYLQYHLLEKPLFEKDTYYLNIFGDYVIEASIDPETASAVDKLYKSSTEWDDTTKHHLQTLVAKGKTKLTISRNERKAQKLKKLLGQYFFVAKR